MYNGTDNLFTVCVSAPGKVILHGDHSVVYGKTAIATSLGLRSSIVIKEIHSDEPVVYIHLPCVELQDSIPLNDVVTNLFNPQLLPGITGKFSWKIPDKLDHDKHLRKVEEFLHTIKPNFDKLQSNQKNSLRSFLYIFSGIFGSTNLKVKSLDISMGSELTIGAGTGSSASFAVCLAGALIQLMRLKSASNNYDAYYDQTDEFSIKEMEIISEWAYNCEKIMHGSPSGIDNATCTFGSLVVFKKGSRPRPLLANIGLRILLVDTRVARQTRKLVVQVASLRQRNTSAVDHIMEACDHLAKSALQLIEKLSSDKIDHSDTEEDYQRLAELWNMNHCLLSALGVSHPSLEHIRSLASRHSLACKLTGAGGGGYALVLLPPSTPRPTIDSLEGELREGGYRVVETTLGGNGVHIEM